MENQHRKIKGYRELNENEIDLMNRIKEHADLTGTLLAELHTLRCSEPVPVRDTPESYRREESFRAIAIARTKLQTGFMWAVRAVACPDSF